MIKEKITKTKYITLMGFMLTLIIVLSILEGFIPALPYLPPGVKLGLSNIVTMYALFFMGKRYAFTLALIKSLFICILRGATAGVLSFCGGILSISVIILLIALFNKKISYLILSISGAIFHNVGQLIAVSILLNSNYVFYYFPFLLVAGIIMGFITGTILKTVMPAFENIFIKNNII